MDDLVERLRICQEYGIFTASMMDKAASYGEAADAIEQLQRQLAEARIDAGIQECLAVSQYKAGVRVGWNLGVSDNHDGMVRASEGTEHIAELNRLKAARAAIRERTD